MVNGFTHVIELAGEASAVATALMLAVLIPKYCAISVDTGLPRDESRHTVTRTRFGSPAGSFRNCTSAGITEGCPLITGLACPTWIELVTAGPVEVRSSQLSK